MANGPGFSPPCPFLEHPGEPAVPLRTWLRIFENYLCAAFPGKLSEDRKCASLLNALGTEGQRLFYNSPPPEPTYKATISALEDLFTPKTTVCAERHRFRKRYHFPDEPIDRYVAALREMAPYCIFGSLEDEKIRDQLIEGVASESIRERLLSIPDLTLAKALLVSQQMEVAKKDAALLSMHDVAASMQSRGSSSPSSPRRITDQTHSARRCFRCGRDSHLATCPNCPAKNARCRKCDKIGHFAHVCRSTKSSVQDDVVHSVFTVSAAPRLYVHLEITINGKSRTVQCMVVTGSTVSILPEALLRKHFGSVLLQVSMKALTTYTQSPLPTLGCFSALVSYKGKISSACFFVVPSGMPLIGMDLIGQLHIAIRGTEIVAAVQPKCSSSKGFTSIKHFVHKVRVRPNVKPVQQKLRRLPLSIKAAVSEELQRLLHEEIIERVDASEWISPVVVVQKKTGGIRLCVDLREPNKAVVADSFPLPHIEDLLLQFQGAPLFSTLNLKAAYHQLTLDENSRDLTAFITHDGLFRFRRVPYGLCSAPSAFQRIMTEILQGLRGVVCYLDDIVVFGQSVDEHDRNLDAVLRRLQQYDVTLNESKCNFRQKDLLFLGYKITSAGICPDMSRLVAVSELAVPKDVHELRSFIGLLSWYSKFIPNFCTIVEPLRALTRAGNTFAWSTEAQECFEKLKRLLLESSALAIFDPSLPTVVATDASDVGIGAVLSQRHPCGTERTVAFASRTLSQSERRYSIGEKEALACVWAVEKWRCWLWGISFELCTDQKALTTLLTSKAADRASMRVARWSARLLPFTYIVRHKPGTLNVVADALSRLPIPCDATDDDENEMVLEISSEAIGIKYDDIVEATRNSPVLQKVINYVQNGWPANMKRVEDKLIPFFRVRYELTVQNNCLIRGTHRLVIPESLQSRLVSLAHENHQGIVRTKVRLRELYWWPGMDTHVETFVKHCSTCQNMDKTLSSFNPPLQPVPYPSAAWEKLGIDIVGPLQGAPYGQRFAITLIDYYSKWPEVSFCHHVTTKEVTNFLSEVFSREGYPTEIVTDNGKQFTSHEFKCFLEERCIRHSRSSLYYPQANGEIERFNRVFKDCLQMASITQRRRTDTVRDFLMTYRTTPHCVTGATPSSLLHGRTLRTKLHAMAMPSFVDDHAIREKVFQRQEYSRHYVDGKKKPKLPQLMPGDVVYTRQPPATKSSSSQHWHPTTIHSQVGKATYKMADGRV